MLLLQSLLADEQLSHCPVLILGNKIDLPGAYSEDNIRQYFGLYGQTTGMVSAVSLKCASTLEFLSIYFSEIAGVFYPCYNMCTLYHPMAKWFVSSWVNSDFWLANTPNILRFKLILLQDKLMLRVKCTTCTTWIEANNIARQVLKKI